MAINRTKQAHDHSTLFWIGVAVVVLSVLSWPFVANELERQHAADSVMHGEPTLVRYDVLGFQSSVSWWLAILSGVGLMICGQLRVIAKLLRDSLRSRSGL